MLILNKEELKNIFILFGRPQKFKHMKLRASKLLTLKTTDIDDVKKNDLNFESEENNILMISK